MKNIIFRRLFSKIGKGQIRDAIICYGKTGYSGLVQKGIPGVKVLQHKYYLCIDLWLVVISFSWVYPKIK